METVAHIKTKAIQAHRDANHLYGKSYPYELHLNWVASVAHRYKSLIVRDDVFDKILATCYLHDSIEDARLTYNDVKEITDDVDVAEAVFALTNMRGRTRKERANDEYYAGIRRDALARFVKLCDRIANMEFGKMHQSGMVEMYRKEMPEFLRKVDADIHYPEMAEYLRSL